MEENDDEPPMPPPPLPPLSPRLLPPLADSDSADTADWRPVAAEGAGGVM